MADKVEVHTGGVFLPLLAVLFIALKLTGYVTWSWLWVLSPLWIPFAAVIGSLLVCLAVVAIAGVLK